MKINLHLLKTLLVISVIFVFSQCKNEQKENTANSIQPQSNTEAEHTLRVAFVNIDSLLTKYNYAKDQNELLLRKMENSRANFNEKGRDFEKDVNEFQRKLKNNAFLSQERVEQEQQRLARKQEDLQSLGQRLESENMTEQNKFLGQMNDSINSFIKEYNKTKKYEAILNSAASLYYDPKLDITNEVLEMLNKRYDSNKKK